MSHHDPSGSRRAFLRNAATVAGAAALAPHVLAQTQPATPPYPDPNEVCVPPTFNPNAAQPMPNPMPFVPVSRPVVQRKSIWDFSTFELDRLNAAYTALRALPADDPRGWLPQAHVHCFYCSGSTGNPSNVEIHGGWYFMPWHRAYLYFHERILASLVGDETFALPYWDWDNPVHSAFPTAYATAPALIDTHRFNGDSPTQYTLEAAFQHYQIDVPTLMQDPDFELFMGTAPDQFNNYGGNIENGPHGLVHVWVGDPKVDFSDPIPDMGILQTAARDPIFFAHHCNIDRLWATWNASSPQHVNPNACRWTDQRFNFYDEKKQWVSIAVADVVDTEKSLFYNYGTSGIANATNASRAKVFLSTTGAQATRQGTEPTTREVPLPSDIAAAPGDAATRQLRRQPKLLLHIDGIHIPPHLGAAVRVFVNLPTANAATPSTSPNYVGYFVVVPKVAAGGGDQHHHNVTNIVLDVSRKLPALLKGAKSLTVTLVPSSNARQKPARIDMTYDRVWVETK